MKRRKALATVVMTAIMVQSLSGAAFASGAEAPDIGGGAQAGKAESTVTMSISETAPISISATVPLTLPLAVQVDSSKGTETPKTFAPTDYQITNNSKDLGTDAGIPIKISSVVATPVVGSGWLLKGTTPTANQLSLGLCGVKFAEQTSADDLSALAPITNEAYTKIAGGDSVNLMPTAAVGGTNGEYTNMVTGAEIYKLQFTIEKAGA